MDTKFRVKGVRYDSKKEAIRQAVQDSCSEDRLSGEIRVVDLAKELGIKDSTLRRWAQEYEEMGEAAFPGNGSPRVNKDYEIVKLRKKVEELERENEMLKKFRAFLSQDHA